MPCGCGGRIAAFEAVGRGSIPRWGIFRLSLECGGGTRLCEGRRPGSTPGRDTGVTDDGLKEVSELKNLRNLSLEVIKLSFLDAATS